MLIFALICACWRGKTECSPLPPWTFNLRAKYWRNQQVWPAAMFKLLSTHLMETSLRAATSVVHPEHAFVTHSSKPWAKIIITCAFSANECRLWIIFRCMCRTSSVSATVGTRLAHVTRTRPIGQYDIPCDTAQVLTPREHAISNLNSLPGKRAF